MNKLIYIIILSFTVTNCSLKPVLKHHGVPFLEKKQASLTVNESNKNDIKKILGNPSTKSTFDNEVWIYIERKMTSSEIKTLGKRKLLLNDVLILEFDDKGMLVKKDFFTKDDMNYLKISTNTTSVLNKKDTFINTFLSSLRQKINDPLGVKKAR